MLTPKKVFKSVPSADVGTSPNNSNNNNDVLVFENGTVLGSVIVVTNSTNNSNNEISITDSSTSNCNNNIQSVCDNSQIINNSSLISANSVSVQSSADDSNCYDTIQTILGDLHTNSDHLHEEINDPTQQSDCIEIPNYSNDLLNSSTCSRDSHQSSKHHSRRKLSKKSYTEQSNQLLPPLPSQQHELYASRFPPQYTAIYLDANNTSGTTATIIGSDNGINQIQQFENGSSNTARIVPVVHRTTIDENGNQRHRGRRNFCRQWFSRPSLPFVIGILALGGVACTLGGIVLGSTGLVEHSTQYLSAALLMIGIGVSLLVISGAIWRLSIPDEIENNCPCLRHLETCRNCNSPFCTNRILSSTGFMYPEFQHRPPPPSYLTSVNECTVGLLLHHEVSSLQRTETVRITTPPPAYRSSNSLSVFVPLHTHHHHHLPSNLHSTDVRNSTVAVEPVEMSAISASTVDNPNNSVIHLKDIIPVPINSESS